MGGTRISLAAGAEVAPAIAQALAALRRDGVVVLDDLVDPALLADCKTEIEADYPHYDRTDRRRHYGPYEKRHTVGLSLTGTLANRAVLLPRPVTAIAKALLGERFMIDSFGLLVAAPGASDQIAHPDGELFPESKVEYLLPTFALAVSVPLVTMDAVTGRTAFWLGSHRQPKVEGPHDFAPVVAPGSAILWDFKTKHCGLANRGERPRPVLYSVLSRYWWVEMHPPEASEYVKLAAPRGVFESMSKNMQYRLHRARLTGDVQAPPHSRSETESAC